MKQRTTILYCRLSRDDGDTAKESNSIQNQRRILSEYADRNGFTPYEFAVDDGYSGTNYNRPGWQDLMTKVESDEVSTIIVKNLDRMGRNYLQTGLYRELFAERGVRLIAVSDGIDTAVGEGDDFLPFREIMAEWYARDCSRKVKAVAKSKGQSGKPLSANPPYGFIKDPEDKNRWLIEDYPASIVRRIFAMTIDGMGPFEIAQALIADKVERPSFYLGSRGRGNHKSTYSEKDKYAWSYTTVTQILAKPEYAGHTVNFRTSSTNFKSKKRKQNAPEDWVIFENTHPAIVSQEVFDTATKLRGTPRRTDTLGEANPLTGKLFCADCGAKLYNHRFRKPITHKRADGTTYTEKNPQDIYDCSTYKITKYKTGAECTPHHIRTAVVQDIILDALRRTSGYIREHEDDFVEMVRAHSEVRQGETAKVYKKQIAQNERRIEELEKIIRSLYEDKALGKIPEERYDDMSTGYIREQEDLKQHTAAFQSELDAFNADSVRAESFIEVVRRYTNFETLTPSMINELIDRVIIYEGEWSVDEDGGKGSRTQKVDVYLNYIGSFNVPNTRTEEEIEAERIAEEQLQMRRKRNRGYARKAKEKRLAAEAETMKITEAASENPKPDA
ncbi:MAG: recombinase family protein [Clostridiales Family XIII bacterium]|nr:recombinase family protein [Clostridiales Family XIII bacterium]